MKINIEPADPIVDSDFFGLPNVKLSPEIKNKNDYEEYDWLLAYLLTALDSFNNQINEARKAIKLKKPIAYPTRNDLGDLYKTLFSLGQKEYLLTQSFAKKIAIYYNLHQNWVFSIQTAIFTNTLTVPTRTDQIKFHIPSDLETTNHYTAIYFTSRVTIGELKQWINKNRTYIRLALDKLPKRNRPKLSAKTLIWGHIAWVFKHDGINSWTEMSKIIQDKIDATKEERVYGEEAAPGPSELEKYYNRFITSLKKFPNI